VTRAIINMGVSVTLLHADLLSLSYMPVSGMAVSCRSSILVSGGISILISIVTVVIYIPTNSI
jgi:hypothetical protein